MTRDNEWAKDSGDWHCNDQSFKSLEDALAARLPEEHIWRDTYIGHSTRGPVCKVCNVDYLCGMSVFGCPGKRLWDSHWIPKTSPEQSEKWVKFKEPCEVTTHYEYENKGNMVLCRRIGGKMTVTRGGAVIAEYDFLPEPPQTIPRVTTLSYWGDPISQADMKKAMDEIKTPFLDYLKANPPKPFNVNDWKFPSPKKIEYLPEEV